MIRFLFGLNASLGEAITHFVRKWHITGFPAAKNLSQIFHSSPLLLVWLSLINVFLYQSVDRIQVLSAYSFNYFFSLLALLAAALLITRLYLNPPAWALAIRARGQRSAWVYLVVGALVVLSIWATNIQIRLVIFATTLWLALWIWRFPEASSQGYDYLRRNPPIGLLWVAVVYMVVDLVLTFFWSGSAGVNPSTIIALTVAIILNTLITYAVERRSSVFDELGRRIASIWQPVSALILAVSAVLWWQPLDTPIMVYILVAVPNILTLILKAAPTIDESRVIRFTGITAVVVGAVALGVQIYTVTYLPLGQYHDEGAYSHIAMLGMQTGRLGGDLYGFPPRNYIGFGNWLYTLGVWYEVFGFGWLSGRLYALVFGLGAMAVLGWAIWRFIDRRVALFAVSLFAMSWLFVEARSIRPDTISLFAISLSLLCFFYALEKRQRWRYALCGFVAALAFEAHLLIAAYWISYGAVFGLQWLKNCLTDKRWHFPSGVLTFGLASTIPVANYFITHFLPDMGLPSTTVLSSQFDLWSGISREIGRWQTHLTTIPSQFESFIVILSIIALVWWGRERRFYVVLLTFGLLGYAVVAPNNWQHYNRFFLPLFMLVIAAAFSLLLQYKPLLRFSMYAVMILCVSLVVFAANIRDELLTRPDVARGMASGALIRPAPLVIDYIVDHVPPGETVVAQMIHYLALDDPYRYIWYNSDLNLLANVREQMAWYTNRELLQQWNPAAIVLDRQWEPGKLAPRDPVIPAIADYLEDNEYVRVRQFEPDFQLYLRSDITNLP